ncbi:MAG: ribosomal-protein-alanine acetyltransferase [Rhodobacteraceae bacterium]|nr:ribosomal-protein-alanine acetyltransferase [Paracoccaceae bacterium]
MAELHAAAFAHSRPWSEAEFEGLLSVAGTFSIGQPMGFALARVIGDEAELLTIATHPAHRRHGMARSLMRAWEAEATGRGAARAFLEVASDNPAARSLYASCGYHQAGQRKGYYRHDDGSTADALIMSKRLRT